MTRCSRPAWLEWFLACLSRALDRAELTMASVLRKARFWEKQATADPVPFR